MRRLSRRPRPAVKLERVGTLYFAYGSNMSSRQMAGWCPEPVALGPAELPGHRLAFLRRSIRWQGGAADIVQAPGESVWGVLWELPLGLGELDAKEAAGDAYRRRTAEVLLGREPHEAVVYEVIRKEPEEVPPRHEYIDEMLAGAREHGLPETWLLRIEQGYYTF
jgi:gamma-glutamyl AIG2-like cyclotransferase